MQFKGSDIILKKIYIPVSILNLILLFILINTSYLVINVSYKEIIIILAITILGFEIIKYAFSRNGRIILTIFILFTIYIIIRNYTSIGSFFNNLVQLAITIDNLTAVAAPVDFSLISPFYILIIPILMFIYLILLKFNLGNVITLVNTILLILFDLLDFSQGVKVALPLYIFLAFINYNLFKFSSKVKKYSKSLVVYYLIVCIILSSVIYWYTPSKEGKAATLVENQLDQMLNRNWALNGGVSDYASVGVNTNEDSTLGKKVQMNNKRLALISGDIPQYLRTKVYYTFSYDRWRNNGELSEVSNYNELNVLDLLPDYGLIIRNVKYNKEKGSKIKTLSVEKLDDRFSNVMISPNYITKVVSIDTPLSMYYNENYLVGEGNDNYTIDYYDYSDTETFESFSKTTYKNDINSLFNGISDTDSFGMTLGIALNFTSSQRVSELAYKITSNASTNMEKVKLIQNYLLTKYKYNLKPNPMSNTSDYVEFFLFDEKKGYCQSFASAAVLLCRAVGIPARYVEGFKVSGNKNSDGSYLLKASNAHAWCEVLLSPDKGIWSILETTPGYQSSLIGTIVNSNIGDEDGSDTEDGLEEINKQRGEDESSGEDLSTSSTTDGKSGIGESLKINFMKIFDNYKYIILAISIVLLFILLKLLRRKLIIKRVTESKSLIPLYGFILKRLKTINITKELHETDKEFAVRIKHQLNIEFLIDAIYKEAYGNENTDLDKSSIISATEELVKNNLNTLKYYMFF